jgi:hypothetical protein
MRRYLDPRKIAETEYDQFVRHVTNTDRGLRQIRRLRTIYQAASQSLGLPVDAAACYEAQVLVEHLIRVKEEISQTMQQIEWVCRRCKVIKCC